VTVKGKIRKMFPGGNTTIGPHFLFEYMIKPAANRIFIIKGGPGVGKSTFMNVISRSMVERGYDVEHFHCASDPDSLDGLIIPSLGVALLDGTAPHIFDPRVPGALDDIINLADFWDASKIEPYKIEIMEINQRGSMQFQTAFRLLKQAKLAYDQWKWYVAGSIDQAKYNRISKMLVETVLESAVPNYHTAPQARHMFGSAITPKGVLDYKDTLIEEDMKVYTIEGQPGTGVKQIIERVAKAAEGIGLNTEQYHCPVEPDKLDMLIIPALRSAVVHNSRPYHFEPENVEGISAVQKADLNICVQKDLLEEYEEDRLDAELRFHDLLKKAVDHLSKAKAAHGEKERYYVRAMNYDLVEKKRNEILKQILKYA
jgi:GTPase SAR1 family protein